MLAVSNAVASISAVHSCTMLGMPPPLAAAAFMSRAAIRAWWCAKSTMDGVMRRGDSHVEEPTGLARSRTYLWSGSQRLALTPFSCRTPEQRRSHTRYERPGHTLYTCEGANRASCERFFTRHAGGDEARGYTCCRNQPTTHLRYLVLGGIDSSQCKQVSALSPFFLVLKKCGSARDRPRRAGFSADF